MKECVTHHICDCKQQELERLREENDELKKMIDSHFPEGPEGYCLIKRKGSETPAEDLLMEYRLLKEALREFIGAVRSSYKIGKLYSCVEKYKGLVGE